MTTLKKIVENKIFITFITLVIIINAINSSVNESPIIPLLFKTFAKTKSTNAITTIFPRLRYSL